MNAFFSLVSRNNKVFRRDKTQVFFSLLSVIIVIALYAIFLQKMQIDALEQVTKATPEMVTMVNEWLAAGLLSMMAVTTTLAAFGITVKDIETKATADFLTAPLSRATIQLSYVANAFLIGLALTLVALIGCEIFIVATGGNLLGFTDFVKVFTILLLSVTLASVFNVFIVQFVSTQNAFSTLGTLIGTGIGFLCGVYVPVGVLPSFAQNLVMYFPISHTTVLLRNTFMQNSISTIFDGVPAADVEAYKINYGVVYDINGHLLNSTTSITIIVVSIAVLTILSIMIFKKKNK